MVRCDFGKRERQAREFTCSGTVKVSLWGGLPTMHFLANLPWVASSPRQCHRCELLSLDILRHVRQGRGWFHNGWEDQEGHGILPGGGGRAMLWKFHAYLHGLEERDRVEEHCILEWCCIALQSPQARGRSISSNLAIGKKVV